MQLRSMRLVAATGAFALGLACLAPEARANVTVSGSIGGAPTAAGVLKVNFDSLALGSTGGNAFDTTNTDSVAVSFVTDAQVVTGSASGQYAAPYLSGSNGVGFGNPNVPGPDTTRYITSGINNPSGGPTGQVTIAFNSAKQYVGLLWGSIDGYNNLSLYSGATLIKTLTGNDVLNSPNGNQGINGTLYVNINSTQAFDKLVFTSNQYAFEFDNLAYSANLVGVPEPSTAVIAIAAGSLLGVYGFRKRRATA